MEQYSVARYGALGFLYPKWVGTLTWHELARGLQRTTCLWGLIKLA